MGKSRRVRARRKLLALVDSMSTETGNKNSDDELVVPDLEVIRQDLSKEGLPLEFCSSKGMHIDGQPNVEAARVGQIRRYQQFQNKKLKEWQIKRLRGTKFKQAHRKSR
jgi:hypothetical protein